MLIRAQTLSGITAVLIEACFYRTGVILCVKTNLNTFKLVWYSPTATCALAHFSPLFMFASPLWIGRTICSALYMDFLAQKLGNCVKDGSAHHCFGLIFRGAPGDIT